MGRSIFPARRMSLVRKIAATVIGCLLLIAILGLLLGWWGNKFDDASFALISALLVGTSLLLNFLGKKARKENRER